MPDFVIPIVFPDYLISVKTPAINVNDYVFDMPWIDILPDKIKATTHLVEPNIISPLTAVYIS